MNLSSSRAVNPRSSINPKFTPSSNSGNGSESKLRKEVRSKINPLSRGSYDSSSLRSMTADSSIDEPFDISAPLLPRQNFTAVGPALLKQFKAIPGDFQAARGRFHRYSPSTQQRMDTIKVKLKDLVQVEKDYKAAIDRGYKAEAECQQTIMKVKLDLVSREFKELRKTLEPALQEGAGGSKKLRQKMLDGLGNMQRQIDEQNAVLNPSSAPLTSEQKSLAQRQRPAKLVRQEAKKQLIEKPKAQSQQSATIGSLVDREKSIGGSSEGVGSLPGSPEVDLPVNQEQPTESDRPPITSFDLAHQEKPISKQKADKIKKEVDAFMAEREVEKAAARHVPLGHELGTEFDAIKSRMKSFETLSYKFDPKTKQLMESLRISMHEIRKDDIGNAALLAATLVDVVNLIESADQWLLAADHLDGFQYGKTMAKMNAFREHLERAQKAASNPSQVG